ncbi:MAG TPA: hypothetical protein VIM07_16145 [Chitinophagaceae bacterium]
MKKLSIAIVFFCFASFLYSCKEKTKTENKNDIVNTDTGSLKEEPKNNTKNNQVATNEAKSYTVIFSPEEVELGKNKEALIRLKNGKALDLVDADGKITGTEFTYDIELKNKNELGGNTIYINPYNFRLQLDNENIITQEKYNAVSSDAQSTNSSTGNKFRLPPGTKPKTLSLFFDETRAIVNVDMR